MTDAKKLLMIDDDADLSALLKLKLEKTGRYECTTATEGSKAIDLAREVSPDLILLDIDMPDMPGGDVAMILSEPEDTKDIPILFLSSLITKADIDEGNKTIAGRQMASKFGSIRELIEKIESILR